MSTGNSLGIALAPGIPSSLFQGPQPGDRRAALIAVSIVSAVITVICVGARMIRARRIRQFRYDDALLLLAGLSLISLNILYCVSTHWGNGLHLSNVALNDIEPAVGYPLKATPLGAACIICAKLAVGGTLLHIDICRTYKVLISATTVIAVLGSLQQLVILCGVCIPTITTGLAGNGHCWPLSLATTALYVSGVANAFTDIMFVLVPLYFLRAVKLSNRDRIALQVLLCSMFIATAVSLAKVAILPNFAKHQLDFTWSGIIPELLGELEALFVVVAACLPAIRQLLSPRLPAWFSGSARRTTKAYPTQAHPAGKLGGISITRSTTTRFNNALDGSVIGPDELEEGQLRVGKHAEITRLEPCEEVEPTSAISDDTIESEKLNRF